jgi:HD-like signal output (HDOD) protein
VDALLSFEATSKILGSVPIPSAPAAYMDLHELMQQDEPDIEAVAATIARDPGLAALVLKTLNSPFFGLRSKVSSIRQATVLLGLLNVGNIVAGLALRMAMEEAGGPEPEHYWDSPVNIGMVAARLAQQLPGVLPDEAYMLGLFHNVGPPLMMQRFDDYRGLLLEAQSDGQSVLEREDERYSTNHAVVGYYVSRSWGLPEHIGDLILRHHDVDGVFADNDGRFTREGGLIAALKMAEHIDKRFWGKNDDPEWQAWGDAVLSYTGISSTDFEDIVEDMIELLGQA